jgi:hypothetical protein
MAKNLLKIVGILTLLAIPRNINENYSIQLKKLEPNIQIKKSEDSLNVYKAEIMDINDIIYSLNKKKDFFSQRLEKLDTPSEIKENYSKNIDETKKEIVKYKKKRDSIYKLFKRK